MSSQSAQNPTSIYEQHGSFKIPSSRTRAQMIAVFASLGRRHGRSYQSTYNLQLLLIALRTLGGMCAQSLNKDVMIVLDSGLLTKGTVGIATESFTQGGAAGLRGWVSWVGLDG